MVADSQNCPLCTYRRGAAAGRRDPAGRRDTDGASANVDFTLADMGDDATDSDIIASTPSGFGPIGRSAVLEVTDGGCLGMDLDEQREPHPGLEPWRPSAAELDIARRAPYAVSTDEAPLYARVDLLVDPDHGPY